MEVTEETKARPEVEFLLKKVYGNDRFYPANIDAQLMCDLMKVATFTKEQLKLCKDAGWKVIVKTEEYKL